MKVFLDANIIVTLLTKQEPLYKSVTCITGSPSERFQLYTSSVGLAIGFYYATKKYGRQKAKQNIALLINHLSITNCGAIETNEAIMNKSVEDFEDGLEYYAALNAGCSCIITEDLNDFYFSKIEVLNSSAFVDKYLLFRK